MYTKNKNKNKTRNLSYLKYFEQLQLEYIIVELRKKIYPSLKDKQYYERVMRGKKDIIEDLAIRNSLKSIFNDKEKRIEKYRQIYNKIGYPNFIYKDERDKEMFEIKDKKNYYMTDSDFKITIGEKEKFGILKTVSFLTQTAEIDLGNDELNIFDLNLITRIL
jgi:hypothetical protein